MGRPRNKYTKHHTFRGVAISLYQRKRGDWEAGFTIPGQGREKASGPDERLCREAAVEKIRNSMDPDEIADRSDEDSARRLLKPHGVTLTESARYYLSAHSHALVPITVAGAREIWLRHLEMRKGKKQFHHHRSSTQRSSHLLPVFGSRQIATVSVADLTHLQDELEYSRAGRTVRNVHDAIKALFKFCRKRGFLAPDRLSAAEMIDRPEAEPGKKGIFTPEEMQRLIDTAWGQALPGALPLAAIGFGSTRSEESCKQDPDAPLEHRLAWEDFRWTEGFIDLREETAKTKEARRAGLPANLKAMLEPLRNTGPLYSSVRLDLAFAKIADKAGVEWKSNGLRHSCITYDVLLAPNAAEVAVRSGNSIGMIESNYFNTRATKQQAHEWFALQPTVAWGSRVAH